MSALIIGSIKYYYDVIDLKGEIKHKDHLLESVSTSMENYRAEARQYGNRLATLLGNDFQSQNISPAPKVTKSRKKKSSIKKKSTRFDDI